MKIQIHPSKGIDDLRFGMQFEAVVAAAERYGPVKVVPGRPATQGVPPLPPRSRKAWVAGQDFTLCFVANDQVHLTEILLYGPEDFASDVTFDYEGLDVFRTPAREFAAWLSAHGRNVLWDEAAERLFKEVGEAFLVPEETLMVARETSQDVEKDPQDGLPRYATQVLVGPKNYYERADAWLNGEAQYTDEE